MTERQKAAITKECVEAEIRSLERKLADTLLADSGQSPINTTTVWEQKGALRVLRNVLCL